MRAICKIDAVVWQHRFLFSCIYIFPDGKTHFRATATKLLSTPHHFYYIIIYFGNISHSAECEQELYSRTSQFFEKIA